ncbi:putative GTPase activating protein for Arf-domain-containing protein [Calycina marina]|uniref:GTPase activating protein for Arf-domain-containing protein n=1 Tax=Calycina marina TaxID=1763456 RepID=A0A9P8CEA1_9HELO|nr:putative GTPase activating protein for Arf-domain-containing protein [Calycina marina]
MSRRAPDPRAERAAQNTQTIKNLLKLEGNKMCADCKRNKHPRWASWNLGIFICIRCSGIHRGMGTHISRVKSVDLDSWTDEQLQSVLKWGNARANKYWEAKLAPGHVPAETKIENFIKTKYDSKRWVMEGPIPDPSTLDAEGDDDMPLSLVKEKHSIERSTSTSQRAAAVMTSSTPAGPSHVKRAPQQDFYGRDDLPQRANSAAPTSSKAPPAPPAPPRQTKPVDSLLGLDFFGEAAPPANRPSSAAATPGIQSRPDLKQSILSLYASRPPQQQQQQQKQPSHAHSSSFGLMQSVSSPQTSPPQATFGGMNDAFGGLSFNQTSALQQPQDKPNAFSNLGRTSSQKSVPAQVTSPPCSGGGGSFFNTKSAARPTQPPAPSRGFSSNGDFGSFDSAPGTSAAPASISSGLGDMFDFSSPAPQAPPKQIIASPTLQQSSSVFNLSQPTAAPMPKAQSAAPVVSEWASENAWEPSDNAWSTSAHISPQVSKPAPSQTSTGNFGWASPGLSNQSIVPGGSGVYAPAALPKVSADEDFGGWSTAAPAANKKPATSFAASDDLFSNVWE